MGAGYGGTGARLTYQESVSFTQSHGLFVLDLLSTSHGLAKTRTAFAC
jgi:hypothetical protein